MWKWIVLAVVGAVAGWLTYDYYRAGLHKMPELPAGAFWLSFSSGMRGIVVDVPDRRPEREYVALPAKVEPWYEYAWSYCHPPTKKEATKAPDIGEGARLEAVCRIDVDGSKVRRGLIYSVPDL